MIEPDLLAGLAQMSARIGADRLLIQGPGGNSSIKDGDELWVKASGQWLAEADMKPIFVPLAMAALRDMDEASAEAVIAARNLAGLKPSIETMLHAIMPHPIVVHAHAVNAMAVSVLADGAVRAADRLEGIAWRWIPYRRPGALLARAVREALAGGHADVLLLQNHGVVVGGEDFAAAEGLLADVERRLALVPRLIPEQDVTLPEAEGFERHTLLSRCALDPVLTDILTGFTLVPDQVVFLGGPIPLWKVDESAAAATARVEAETGIRPAALMRPGVGAVAAPDRTAATEAMIEGLVEIARRLPEGAALSSLSVSDITELTGWEAEHYRRNIDAARR